MSAVHYLKSAAHTVSDILSLFLQGAERRRPRMVARAERACRFRRGEELTSMIVEMGCIDALEESYLDDQPDVSS